MLDFSYGHKDIQDFVSLFEKGALNLEPGFQRKSVWGVRDRQKLIQSILQNYPIPSVFLYKSRDEGGRHKYDVLDGKQRLESILMFLGEGRFRSLKFDLKAKLHDDEEVLKVWDWNKLKRGGHEHRIMGYKIQIVEVSGDLTDIIDLFVRINSTGKSLTSQEKRHAQFYHSDFLKLAGRLGNKHLAFFQDNKIASRAQIDRQKHIELICELLASLHTQQLLNKKSALDSVISGQKFTAAALEKLRLEFERTLKLLKKMFPDLRSTRFVYSAEFYSLFMLIWSYERNKMILTDNERNHQAQVLLQWLSNGVDELREKISKADGAKAKHELFSQYLFTTRADSDSAATRKRREDVLNQLFKGLFDSKDERRGFSKEQRRILWNSEDSKKCAGPCGKPLTWENFTIDHIRAHARGGKSDLSNAALMCRRCNSKKGQR